jgi:two-component system cell cycle response regulator DivK
MPKTVLIVEDNELNMKLFADILEAHGYEVIRAVDGMEGLQSAKKYHPDLVLMDIQLPEISGIEVIKTIKQDPNLKHIPIVAISAFAMNGDRERIMESGCETYISKPVNVGRFVEVIKEQLSVSVC